MYKVLDKDIIENEILPYLSTAKRGFKTKSCLSEIINCILYKLKTGVQWYLLPVKSLFSDVVLSYKTVYYYYRKWCKHNVFETMFVTYLEIQQDKLNTEQLNLNGTHSLAKKSAESAAYQYRKKAKTSNILILTDGNGFPIANGGIISGIITMIYIK